MSRNGWRGGSAALARARRQFQNWRRTKQGRERIPDALWAVAVDAALEHGVNKTSRALGLNHSALQAEAQKRAAVAAAADASPAEFVELPMLAVGRGAERVLEADNGHGTKLRIHFKGGAGADLTSLAVMLWRSER